MREVEILKKKQLKCYLYTRVSTSMQVDGYSLDAQRDKLRKYAAYEDMIVAGEYSDEGFSGKNIQGRQDFQRMLNDIQDGKDDVSYVLVFKLSRFGRNAADFDIPQESMPDARIQRYSAGASPHQHSLELLRTVKNWLRLLWRTPHISEHCPQ